MEIWHPIEVKLRDLAVHRHQNEHAYSNVHQAEILYVQFTFAQNMNEFMNHRSVNAFRHNTDIVSVRAG